MKLAIPLAILAIFLVGCSTSPSAAFGNGCDLMRTANGEEQCFGCANGVCTEPQSGYTLVDANSDRCGEGEQGCYLQDLEDDDESLGDKIDERVNEYKNE